MLNYDVIRIICAEITDDSAHSAPPDLLSLGLSSRIFLEPALDVMWQRMNSIEPLLSILPETRLINRKKMILKPISPSSWDRLRFYTSRVREFVAPLEQNVHDSVYARLGHENPIFPKLSTLHLSPRLCDSKTFLFFLATSLQVVSWPYPWLLDPPPDATSSDMGPSLSLLVSKSPELRHLTLSKYLYSGLSLTLKHLVALERLSVMDLSHLEEDFIQAIALLPKLTYLYLTLPAGIVLDHTGVERGFPSLTKLRLHGSTSDTRKLLAVVKPHALQELVLDLGYEFATEESRIADVAAIIHLLPSYPFLRNLAIDGDALTELPMDLEDLQLWLIFEPLLELKRLELLDYNISLPVSDQKTLQIACAWTHLKELHVYHDSIGGLASLESLAHFARHCPNLESLSYPIQLQADTAPTPVIQNHPTLPMHPLRSFWCNMETDETTTHSMAQGLYRIFPNLQEVDGPGDAWTQVQKSLWSLQNRQFEG
ncbi:hypothetical protein BDP27DRAFT_1325768 [Rhodocollybia butyracea]|uniref:F-box domain-containing protein n=1 Tax=Rhodocollybia butyracea TaxID=206335 RepID=A0A9P5U7V5_9AGAR|nr:hypothetical protein BDP27DRAFT_1325768 [Rhodocollybia butyracea]